MEESIETQFVDWLDVDNIAHAVYEEVAATHGRVTIELMQKAWLAVCGDLYQIIRERL